MEREVRVRKEWHDSGSGLRFDMASFLVMGVSFQRVGWHLCGSALEQDRKIENIHNEIDNIFSATSPCRGGKLNPDEQFNFDTYGHWMTTTLKSDATEILRTLR